MQPQVQFKDDVEQSKLGVVDKSVLDMHIQQEESVAKAQINHEHWLRIKEH